MYRSTTRALWALTITATLTLGLTACDAADPALDPGGPPDVAGPGGPLTNDQTAIAVEAFEDVESLFDLGFADGGTFAGRGGCQPLGDRVVIRPTEPEACRTAPGGPFDAFVQALVGGDGPTLFGDGDSIRPLSDRVVVRPSCHDTDEGCRPGTGRSITVISRGFDGDGPAASLRAPDTTTYTGVYDNANNKGYLVVTEYREPQGIGIWRARVQHARSVDHDDDASTAEITAVETVRLTFLDRPDLDTFLADLDAGQNAYLLDASDDAQAAFNTPEIDVWRVSQVFSANPGEAVVTYANASLREAFTIRDPIITRRADGTGTVRDGGLAGSVRTRYYGADFQTNGPGNFSGTLLRTLQTTGDLSDGALLSRNDYPDGSFRQTKQRGGDGVVVRENTEG